MEQANPTSQFLIRHASLRQIQIFEAVARNLSFTKAAKELHLTQPTVSAQVKSFGDALDVSLYEQIGRKIYLTEVGEKVAGSCREIIDHLSNMEIMLDDYKGLKKGRLRVAVVTTAKYFAPVMLGEFVKKHENIDIELKVTNRENILKRIDENLDDLYILGQVPKSHLDLKVIPFAPNPLVMIANRNHPLVGQHVSLERISQEPFIMREEGSGMRKAVRSLFKSKGLEIKERLIMETNESIKHCVVGDLGVACVSKHALTLNAAADYSPIVELDVEGFPIHKHWNIVHRQGKELSIIAQDFLKFLTHKGQEFVKLD